MERLVAVLLALMPLAVFPFLELPYEPPKVALLAVIAALGCFHTGLSILRGAKITARWSAVDAAVLGFLFVLACSTLASVDPAASFWGSSERQTSFAYYACATALYAYVRVFFCPAHWRLLLAGTAVTGAAVAAYACAQGMGVDFPALRQAFPLYGVSGPQRAFSTFGHPNFLGAYLAVTLPWLLVLGARHKKSAMAAALLSACAIGVTYSRAAWLAVPASAAVYAFFHHPRARKWILAVTAVCVAASLALAVFYPRLLPPSEQNRRPLAYRVLSTFDASHGSVLARRNEWTFAWDLITKRPVLGYGLDTYMPFAATRVKDMRESAPDYRGFDPSVADRIHNQVLDLLWAAGVAGLGVFLLVVASVFRRAWERRGSTWAAMAAASAAAYLVTLQFGFDFSLSFPWLLLAAAALHVSDPFADHSVTETAGVV